MLIIEQECQKSIMQEFQELGNRVRKGDTQSYMGKPSQEAGMIWSPVSLGWIPPSRFKGMMRLDSMISSR